MSKSFLSAISIPVEPIKGCKFLIEDAALEQVWNKLQIQPGLPDGWQGVVVDHDVKKINEQNSPIVYDSTAPERGLQALALKEYRRYRWIIYTDTSSLEIAGHNVTSSLKGADKAKWLLRDSKPGIDSKITTIEGEFSVGNYLVHQIINLYTIEANNCASFSSNLG